jgi:hypothetical protein
MQPAKLNYKIYQGSTFEQAYRWESETKVYVPIASITKAAPCEITTTTAHSLPMGWRFKVVGAGGMKEINSVSDSTEIATYTTSTLIRVNQVNSLGYTTYTSGGVVEYNQPVSLTGYSARMQIRESVDSTTVIYEASSSTGQIVLNNSLGTITITIPASATTLFTFTTAVYAVELFDSNGKVIPFLVGNLTLVPEVTR